MIILMGHCDVRGLQSASMLCLMGLEQYVFADDECFIKRVIELDLDTLNRTNMGI
jgi:hypothetical protein